MIVVIVGAVCGTDGKASWGKWTISALITKQGNFGLIFLG